MTADEIHKIADAYDTYCRALDFWNRKLPFDLWLLALNTYEREREVFGASRSTHPKLCASCGEPLAGHDDAKCELWDRG